MPDRIIRQSIRTSPTIDMLSFEAESMFYRLTTVVDDFGRFDADPRLLLSNCFPLKVDRLSCEQVASWFDEIVCASLVWCYHENNRLYGQFSSWDTPQHIPPINSIEDHTDKAGFVYLLKCGPYYKIGRTTNIERRVAQLAIQLPEKPELIHIIECLNADYSEKFFHRQLAFTRLNGEWFDLSHDLVEWIKSFHTCPKTANSEKV